MSNKNTQTEFPAKWLKVVDKMPEFKDTADAASVDELKKMIVTSEGHIYTVDQEKAADVKLTGAKELVKEYSEGYRDSLKCLNAKIKYALFLLEGKGVDLG